MITSSDPQATQVLTKGDVVKIQLGAHIDGFAAVTAETMVVGASAADPVTGRQADVIKAAWTAAEVAMRLVKVGTKNWAVTEGVARTVQTWGCKPVEGIPISFCVFWHWCTDRLIFFYFFMTLKGMLSCQQTQNVIDGKKRIILNPSEGQRKDFETVTFAEGEVYGIDILISSGEDGKVTRRTTLSLKKKRSHLS